MDFFYKFLLKAKPSEYLSNLKKNNKLGNYPMLLLLNNCIHDPLWHPEGNVWEHTLMVLDIAAELKENISDENEKLALMLGALCHDLGKPFTTDYQNKKVRSLMHDQIGIIPTNILLDKLMVNDCVREKTIAYVKNHLVPLQLYSNMNNVSDRAIEKLEKRIHIPHLALLTKADHWGRTDNDAINRICEPADWLLYRYNKIFG